MTPCRKAALAACPILAALAIGDARAWTVLKATSCDDSGSYAYQRQVTIVSGSVAQNTLMSAIGEWRPDPKLTTIKVDTLGKGTVTVRRLCKADPWAAGASCTDQNVVSQTNAAWGLPQVLKVSPDILAPKTLLPPFPAKVPVPVITSEKWGGSGLPLAIRVSGTGPRCAFQHDELRVPAGTVYPKGPTGLSPGSVVRITAQHLQPFKQSGTFAIRSRIRLWTGNGWKFGDWSPWYEFPYAPLAQPAPPGPARQAPTGPARPKP